MLLAGAVAGRADLAGVRVDDALGGGLAATLDVGAGDGVAMGSLGACAGGTTGGSTRGGGRGADRGAPAWTPAEVEAEARSGAPRRGSTAPSAISTPAAAAIQGPLGLGLRGGAS